MSKSRLTRFKKIVFCFSVVVSLCFTNFALFSVRVSAANALPSDTIVRSAGAPVNLNFTMSPDAGDYFTGIIPSANVYAYNSTSSTYSWYGSLYDSSTDDVDQLFRFHYPSGTGSSEVQIYTTATNGQRSNLVRFDISLSSPVIFTSLSDLVSYFDFIIQLDNCMDSSGDLVSHFNVTSWFTFMEGGISGSTLTRSYSRTIETSGKYAQFRFFDPYKFTYDFLSDVDTFHGSDGVDYYFLLSGSVYIDCYSTKFYMDQNVSSVYSIEDYNNRMNDRYSAIYSGDYYTSNINFENIDWTDWLVNSVSGFMNFQIVPGLSFANMLGLLVGMSLFIVFLKVFAGG